MRWIFAGEQRRSRRGAQRWHVVAVENDAVVSESVDVGRRDLVGAVETDVVPTLNKIW